MGTYGHRDENNRYWGLLEPGEWDTGSVWKPTYAHYLADRIVYNPKLRNTQTKTKNKQRTSCNETVHVCYKSK